MPSLGPPFTVVPQLTGPQEWAPTPLGLFTCGRCPSSKEVLYSRFVWVLGSTREACCLYLVYFSVRSPQRGGYFFRVLCGA